MASNGIRRKVDDLGRVVIPAGIRRALNIREGDAVEVSVEGERVVLARPRDACVFCGREDDTLHRFRGRLVCRDCVGTIGGVDERLRATEAADRQQRASAAHRMPSGPFEPPPLDTASTPARPPAPVRAREVERAWAPAAADDDAAWRAPRTPPAGPVPRDVGGHIDGDALPRDQRSFSVPGSALPDDPRRRAPDGDRRPPSEDQPAADDDAKERPGRRPSGYDPASTTAW